jgi:uncharacterized protein involved in exopolysaccharide biosynthesis
MNTPTIGEDRAGSGNGSRRGASREIESSELLHEDEINLFDYIEVMVRRRRLIIFCALVCALTAAVITWNKPVSYRAEASVLPSQETTQIDTEPRQESPSNKYIGGLKSTTTARSMLERGVPVPGKESFVPLRDYLAGDGAKQKTKQCLEALAECSKFEQSANEVITIAVTLKDSAVAVAIANAYVEELIQFYTNKVQAWREKELEALNLDKRTQGHELEEAENALLLFQQQNTGLLSGTTSSDPELALELRRLNRKVKVKEDLYTAIVHKYELARINARSEAPTFEVLHRARAADVVIVTKGFQPINGFMYGGLVGIAASVLLAFFFEYHAKNKAQWYSLLEYPGWEMQLLRRLLVERKEKSLRKSIGLAGNDSLQEQKAKVLVPEQPVPG